MYGYIYMTTNSIDSFIYIGKKALSKFRPTYHGAGKYIKNMRKLYGDDIFITVLLAEADSPEELNSLEKEYIMKYKAKYGDQCVNIANGGDGGNTFKYASDDAKLRFIETMTEINKNRTNTEEFKNRARARMIARYKNPIEREKHSKKIREVWNSPDMKEMQSKRLKDYYKTHKKDGSFNFKACCMILDNNVIEFESVKALKKHLHDEYGITFANPTLKEMLSSEIPYKPFHKNKPASKKLSGMILKYIK